MTGNYFKREFISGYAAHVPRLNEMFGISTGQMVKLITNGEVDSFHSASYSVERGNIKRIVPKKLGFIGSYAGHLRGVKAENMHGKC